MQLLISHTIVEIFQRTFGLVGKQTHDQTPIFALFLVQSFRGYVRNRISIQHCNAATNSKKSTQTPTW